MGKFLESIGVIDGYDIVAIGKHRAKKDKLFVEIEKIDSKIKDEVRETANTSSGRIFAIVKKSIIKGIYLFKAEEKEGVKELKHVKTVYSDEVSKEVREKYDKHILNAAKDYVSYKEYDKVLFDDKVVQIDPKKSKKEQIIAGIGGFALGFIIGWLIFDGIIGGIIYGVIFGPLFSGLSVVVTNQRDKKNKDKDEEEKE